MSKQDAQSQQVKLQVSSLRVPNVKTVHPAMVRRAISWQKSGMGAATIMPRETIIVAGAGARIDRDNAIIEFQRYVVAA